jgi:hypothetical protein
MFALGDADFRGKILGCADGPAGFNVEATRCGVDVTSCDPLYQWTTEQIRDRIRLTSDDVLEQARRNQQDFVWTSIRTVEELHRLRMLAMNAFLDDYERGKAEGRYLEAALPSLPFDDGLFDLALCSHFLFLYTDQLGATFHRAAVSEMCRVAREVRIFPLLTLGGLRSPYVDDEAEELRKQGFEASIEDVNYEFQRGAHQMLRIRRRDERR